MENLKNLPPNAKAAIVRLAQAMDAIYAASSAQDIDKPEPIDAREVHNALAEIHRHIAGGL